jgi:UDP-N-acetylmuramyl pentapeptide phosphotransferase/UDP-N-acetylglucosamine-1-phosphate transferase
MRYGGLLLLVLVIFTVVKYAVWIGLVVAIVALVALLWKFTGWIDRWLERREEHRRIARAWLAAIARRADEQHAQVLAGDDRGIYGDYAPAVYPTA